MAVSTTNAVSGPYVANGVTTSFPFTFKALDAGGVRVTLTTSGVETEIAPTEFATILNEGGNGGSIAFGTAPAAGDLLIYSDPAFSQEAAFSSGQRFSPTAVNDALDRAAIRDQYLLRKVDAAIDAIDAGILGDVRSDLTSPAPGKGASLVAYSPAVAYPEGTVGSQMKSISGGFVSPEEYGAVGDGVADDRAAYIRAEAEAIATGKRLRLSGHYNIGTSYYALGAANFYGDGPDPKIIGAALLTPGGNATGVPIAIEYSNGTVSRIDELSPSYKRPFSERTLWLGAGDQKSSRQIAVPPPSLALLMNDFPGSDTWSAADDAFVGATGIGFAPTAANRWYAAMIPVHGGMELTASISGGDLNRGVVVLCTGGSFGFYAPDSGAGDWFYKPTSGAVVSGSIDWAGRTTHDSWKGRYVLWTLRLYDHKTIGVLLNGTEVYRHTLASGHIVRGGFMAMRTAAGAAASIEYITANLTSAPQGGRSVRLAIYGDSKSEAYFGDWADAFREALDGSCGIRAAAPVNHAVSGQNSLDQLAVMTASPPAGMTDVVIHIGTNDIQAGAISEVSVANIGAMIDIAESHGCQAHLVVPDLWYTPAQAGGFGEATSNYAGGARTRAAIANLAAARGCSVTALPQILGPVLGSQITSPDGSDPRLRDNIHPTASSYRIVGREIAKRILQRSAREMQRAVPLHPLPGALAGGWSAGANTPSFSLSEEGVFRASGDITPGSKADGTTIYTSPLNLRPAIGGQFTAASSPSTFAVISIDDVTGEWKIWGAASAQYICLDGISFQTKGLFG